tara:strand:+ start:1906 stop:2340 length:435 start_codon:yes stop_codon:yes gene_type:complete
MNIGQASKQSGVSQRMIRHYEAIGLIPKAPRRESGYRDYDARDLHMLRFIRRARDLGFPIEEIRQLLALWKDRGRSSADVKSVALARVGELRNREAEIRSMRRSLEDLARACHGDDRPDCPILSDLAGDSGDYVELGATVLDKS